MCIEVINRSADVTSYVATPTRRYMSVISYDLLSRVGAELLHRRYGIVILDESHNIKNNTARRTQAALALCRQAERRLLLSGTPSLNRPSELFTQLNCLAPHLFNSFKHFALRYCNGHQTRFGFDHRGSSHLLELHTIIKRTCLIRRIKSEVLAQLPPKRRSVVVLALSDAAKQRLSSLSVSRFESAVRAAVDDSSTPSNADMMTMYRLTGTEQSRRRSGIRVGYGRRIKWETHSLRTSHRRYGRYHASAH